LSYLPLPAPCCLLPCWGLTAYLPPCLWGLALPHPPPLSWPHFPQVPGNAPLLCWAQSLHCCYTLLEMKKSEIFNL
jgi:hypothetical protein